MARKRLFEEIDSFAAIDKPLPNASIHAAITSLSPVKRGKNSFYFDGMLTDGTTNLRVVGFTAEQQKKLAPFLDTREAACLTNCEVKKSRSR